MISGDQVGPLELLVIQPTPFCNLDCTYCYLPDRLDKRKMTLETLEKTLNWAFSSGLVRQPLTLLWHAGEPMVLPPTFYEQAALLIERCNTSGFEVTQSFQTNATLVSDAWCDLIRRRNIQVGVSVDGPDFLNDRNRLTRQGGGTLDRILRGMQKLRDHDIFFDVISVLTSTSLDYPDELFDFYIEHGITNVAFNVEEIEGPHVKSSLAGSEMEARFRRFYSRFMDLALASDPPLRVREFDISRNSIAHREQPTMRTQECRPFGILNVDCMGNFSTYSPELLGLSSPRLGNFALGNVATDTLESVLAMPRFVTLDDEIRRGVDRCEETCRYFPFCGGGPPGNKYFENGDFSTTETLSCRLHKKATFDVALDKLERLQAMA
jgi:uncharacterized protein